MYVPAHFREDRPEVLQDAIRRIGFGTLITETADGPQANHVPMLLEGGVLRGHLARANPVWQITKAGSRALAVFLGPHAYVSPNWYPTKAETGKAVPTWNYLTVQARGTLTLFDDADRLRAHVTALSNMHEADRPQPWAVDDAPGDYIDGMLRAIVGFELAVTKLEGKWKLSQNRPDADREGVRDAFLREGGDVHVALAKLMAKPMDDA